MGLRPLCGGGTAVCEDQLADYQQGCHMKVEDTFTDSFALTRQTVVGWAGSWNNMYN